MTNLLFIISILTNQPPQGFSAGGLPSYYYSPANCQTVNFKIEAESGEYDMQWSYALNGNWHTVYNEADATQRDRDNGVNPPIVVHSQSVITWYPSPKFSFQKTAFWRLKKR